MKIISYSDIHLEFDKDLTAPAGSDADLMILSGDILNMHNPGPLDRFLAGWRKPVLFIPGNHEYYTDRPMSEENRLFREWLAKHHPNVIFLADEAVTIDGIQFFGGTMWTDFGGGNAEAMAAAQQRMHDFAYIRTDAGERLVPADTIPFHAAFRKKLIAWFETPLPGPRVVISHHAPVLHPQSQHEGSILIPAFNSLDMVEVIRKYQPDVWFYGHTHECDRQRVGRTRMMSNQLGYRKKDGAYECQTGFDEAGAMIEVGGASLS